MMAETEALWAWRTVSEAFAELESLAETIETDSGESEAYARLSQFDGLDTAFRVIGELVKQTEALAALDRIQALVESLIQERDDAREAVERGGSHDTR